MKGALRITCVDPEAHRQGIAAGMTLADARARVPGLEACPLDAAADQRFMLRIAAACDRYTPMVEVSSPEEITLDITGVAHLFGGEDDLVRALSRRVAAVGLTHRVAVAGAPDAARAFARHGAGGVTLPGEDERRARDLPVRALDAAAEVVVALNRAGLRTLGDLLDRPSASLTARFGEDVSASLRRIAGREDRRITPLRPPPDCMLERSFAEPLMQADAALEALRLMLKGVMRQLEGRGAGGRRFEVAFYRVDGAVRRIEVGTGRPTRDGRLVQRLFEERLDALADPLDPGFGFDAMRLAVPFLEPIEERQAPILTEHAGEADPVEAAERLADRLAARFGRDRVLRFEAGDSHQPERAVSLRAAADPQASPSMGWPVRTPGEPPLRPLQIFEPPQPIEALAEVPDGPPLRFRWRRVLHEVVRAEGPERIAPEWWRNAGDAPTRDYYRIEDREGRRFWVFRRGVYGAAEESAAPRWFMHGLFA